MYDLIIVGAGPAGLAAAIYAARAELKATLLAAGLPEYFEYEIDVVDFVLQNVDQLPSDLASVLAFFNEEALRDAFGEYATYTIAIPVADALVFSIR